MHCKLFKLKFVFQAIEFSQKGEKVPSCILTAKEGKGGLFHGGFKAVMNTEFLVQENVTHILNTAKGLEIFGPKYLVRVYGLECWNVKARVCFCPELVDTWLVYTLDSCPLFRDACYAQYILIVKQYLSFIQTHTTLIVNEPELCLLYVNTIKLLIEMAPKNYYWPHYYAQNTFNLHCTYYGQVLHIQRGIKQKFYGSTYTHKIIIIGSLRYVIIALSTGCS